MDRKLRIAANVGDTAKVIALLDGGANINATTHLSFSFSDSFCVWFADSSTLTLILTRNPDLNPSCRVTMYGAV